MNTTQYDSRTADKFVVRLPQGLRDQIDATAIVDDRSMNSVIVQAVKQYLDAQSRQELLLNALASAVLDDKVRVNQISETGESVNKTTGNPVANGARSLIASMVAAGDTGINEARQSLAGMNDLQPFSIDAHVRLVADAERYRWLRNNACTEDVGNGLMVVRGDSHFNGDELNTEIDNAMRLARMEDLSPCAD